MAFSRSDPYSMSDSAYSASLSVNMEKGTFFVIFSVRKATTPLISGHAPSKFTPSEVIIEVLDDLFLLLLLGLRADSGVVDGAGVLVFDMLCL